MKAKVFLILVIIILVTLVAKMIYFNIEKEKVYLRNIENAKAEVERYKHTIKDIYLLQQFSFIIEKGGLNTSVEIMDRKEKELLLSDISIDQRLILYFENDMCEPCIDKTITNFEKVLDFFAPEDVFVFVKGYKRPALFNDKRLLKFSNLYWVKNNIFKNEDVVITPTIAYIDTNKKLEYVYCSSKNISFDFEKYYFFLKQLNIKRK